MAKVRTVRAVRWGWILLLWALAGVAQADVFRPAYLELREAGGDNYEVLWKVPAQSETMRLSLQVRFPRWHAGAGRAT